VQTSERYIFGLGIPGAVSSVIEEGLGDGDEAKTDLEGSEDKSSA
jgi:hypothetical protein